MYLEESVGQSVEEKTFDGEKDISGLTDTEVSPSPQLPPEFAGLKPEQLDPRFISRFHDEVEQELKRNFPGYPDDFSPEDRGAVYLGFWARESSKQTGKPFSIGALIMETYQHMPPRAPELLRHLAKAQERAGGRR